MRVFFYVLVRGRVFLVGVDIRVPLISEGAAKVRLFGVVYPVRVQRRRPKRLRHVLGEASLLGICFVADCAIHGKTPNIRPTVAP